MLARVSIILLLPWARVTLQANDKRLYYRIRFYILAVSCTRGLSADQDFFCGSDFHRRFIVVGNGLIDLYHTLFLFYCGFILSELQFAHSSKKNIHECVTDLGFFMCLGNYYWATKQRKLWVSFGYRSDIRNLMHRHVNAFVNNSNKNFFMLQ